MGAQTHYLILPRRRYFLCLHAQPQCGVRARCRCCAKAGRAAFAIDTVELEIVTAQRGQLDQELQQQMTAAQRTGGGDVEVDEEHQLWPFDGEYWRDELGFYRQQVTNQCGR